MSDLVNNLRNYRFLAIFEPTSATGNSGYVEVPWPKQAACRIEELERQLSEAREANEKLHRRAQTSEGKLQRMEEAHRMACRHAFTKSIDYRLYAYMLLNCNQSLFPKLVNKGGILPDPARDIRNKALEEAAQVAESAFIQSYAPHQHPEKIAAAIRALSESSLNPLPEQRDNIGGEGE